MATKGTQAEAFVRIESGPPKTHGPVAKRYGAAIRLTRGWIIRADVTARHKHCPIKTK